MRSTKILVILFITSLLLLGPLFKPGYEIEVFPIEKKTSIVSIEGSGIHITSNIKFPISMNVSFMDPKTLELSLIYSNEFIGEEMIKNIKSGNYFFEFFVNDIATVIIESIGLQTSSIIIIGLISLITLVNYIRARFFSVVIEY